MKLRMLASLGMHDARRLGLDQDDCHEGATIDADAKVGEELLRRGWATDAPEPKVKAEPPKAEPFKPEPFKAEPGGFAAAPAKPEAPGRGPK